MECSWHRARSRLRRLLRHLTRPSIARFRRRAAPSGASCTASRAASQPTSICKRAGRRQRRRRPPEAAAAPAVWAAQQQQQVRAPAAHLPACGDHVSHCCSVQCAVLPDGPKLMCQRSTSSQSLRLPTGAGARTCTTCDGTGDAVPLLTRAGCASSYILKTSGVWSPASKCENTFQLKKGCGYAELNNSWAGSSAGDSTGDEPAPSCDAPAQWWDDGRTTDGSKTLLVMEYADQRSLHTAISAGRFKGNLVRSLCFSTMRQHLISNGDGEEFDAGIKFLMTR